MEDLLSVLPFGGTFDLVELSGSTLRKTFEYAVRRYGTNSGEFLQVSGTAAPLLSQDRPVVPELPTESNLIRSCLDLHTSDKNRH